jgi:hypothetical protein
MQPPGTRNHSPFRQRGQCSIAAVLQELLRTRNRCVPLMLGLWLYALAVGATPGPDESVLPNLAQEDGNAPIVIASSGNDDRFSGTADGTIAVPFEQVRAALADPRHWCQLITLHLNIKA